MPELDSRKLELPANAGTAWSLSGQAAQPRSSRVTLWLVLAVVILLIGAGAATWFFANGAASSLTKRGVTVEALQAGAGASPTRDDSVLINYKGTLPDGTIFDQAQQAAMPLEGVIPGFADALFQMQRGGKYKVFIPSERAYGAAGIGPIPPNTDLTWEVELIDIRNTAAIERDMQALQAQQAQTKADPDGKKSPVPDNAGSQSSGQ